LIHLPQIIFHTCTSVFWLTKPHLKEYFDRRGHSGQPEQGTVSAVPFYFLYNKGGTYLKEYLKSQSKTNEIIMDNMVHSDELDRFSKSDFRWADNKAKPFRQRSVKKGEIYQFEFGKNYIPEMSYEHRGLVIGVKQKLLYVLPIFSYDPIKHTDVYHPFDFPTSKSDMFLLKSCDFSFISHDSVLKLNDIRTVSINRILYQHDGRIDPSSVTYKEIESLVLKKYFPGFLREYEQCIIDTKLLNEQISTLTEDKLFLEKENYHLRAEIELLRDQLKINQDH
jgi:hypothetical protein